MGPEAKIEAYLVKRVKEFDTKALKFVSPSMAGVTDRLIPIPFSGGRVAFAELKNGKAKLTPLQEEFKKFILSIACIHEIIRSKEDVDLFIEKYFWHL